MTKTTSKLITDLSKAQTKVSKLQYKLNKIQENCEHEFPVGPFWYGGNRARPEGYIDFVHSETCVKCGKDCHDREEWL